MVCSIFDITIIEHFLEFHKVFLVTIVTFLVTLLMNNFTSTVVDDKNLDEMCANY